MNRGVSLGAGMIALGLVAGAGAQPTSAAELRIRSPGDQASRPLTLACTQDVACGGEIALGFQGEVRRVTVDAMVGADIAYVKFHTDDGPLYIGAAKSDFLAIPLTQPGTAHLRVEVIHPTHDGVAGSDQPRTALVDIEVDTTR
jgi:hypothetical protein